LNRFRQLIDECAGISPKDAKRVMLSNRLRKRLETCGFSNDGQYCHFITQTQAGRGEIRCFANSLTTHETHFYRHPEHFHYFATTAWPALTREKRARSESTARIWCAGCSSGEEPYSIVMALLDTGLGNACGFRIPGTDINPQGFCDFSEMEDGGTVADSGMLIDFGGRSLLTVSPGQSLMAHFESRYRIRGLYF
jgi:chemotaxis protein methyltransferase CheR